MFNYYLIYITNKVKFYFEYHLSTFCRDSMQIKWEG